MHAQPGGRVVFVLGAGASYEAGCPVMNGFFDRAQSLFWRGRFERAGADFENVQQARVYLSRAYARTTVDINNLESVFTAIEMGEFLASNETSQRQFRDWRASLVRIIAETLEQSAEFRVGKQYLVLNEHGLNCFGQSLDQNDPRVVRGQHLNHFVVRSIMPDDAYRGLCSLRQFLLENQWATAVDFVTFNYDIAFEVALTCSGVSYSYGLPGDETSESDCLVAKLHGSLNWHLKNHKDREVPVADDKWKHTLIPSWQAPPTMRIRPLDHCMADPTPPPFIVPPSESKRSGRLAIQSVWKAASNRLRRADTIVFIGFSLPPTDIFFRELFAMSSISEPGATNTLNESILRKIVVVDPNDEVEARYKSVLGGHARQVLTFRHCGMLEALGTGGSGMHGLFKP